MARMPCVLDGRRIAAAEVVVVCRWISGPRLEGWGRQIGVGAGVDACSTGQVPATSGFELSKSLEAGRPLMKRTNEGNE